MKGEKVEKIYNPQGKKQQRPLAEPAIYVRF
jgi:hypothetical protein